MRKLNCDEVQNDTRSIGIYCTHRPVLSTCATCLQVMNFPSVHCTVGQANDGNQCARRHHVSSSISASLLSRRQHCEAIFVTVAAFAAHSDVGWRLSVRPFEIGAAN